MRQRRILCLTSTLTFAVLISSVRADTTTAPASLDAASLVSRAVTFAKQMKDPAKRDQRFLVAADIYLSIGRETDADLIVKELSASLQRSFENSRLLRKFADKPEELLKAASAETDLEQRTQLYTILRARFLQAEKIDLIQRTLGEDQRDYPRDLGIESLVFLYLQRDQIDDADRWSAKMKNEQLKTSTRNLIAVARVLAAGNEDPHTAAATRDIAEEPLDRALEKIVQYRSKKGDLKNTEKALTFVRQPGTKAFALLRLALAQFEAGRKKEAIGTVAEAEKLIPQVESIYRDLVRNGCLLTLIDIESQQVIDKVRSMDKESQDTFSPMLISALIKIGRPDDAIKTFLAGEDHDLMAYQVVTLLARYGYSAKIDEILNTVDSADTKSFACLLAAQAILAAQATTRPTPVP